MVPPFLAPQFIQRFTGLASLAVCNTLRKEYALPAQIKWPNDVLVDQHKVAGVLAEARWDGEKLKAAVIGIGINIAPESVNPVNLPPEGQNFPATCVEDELGHPLIRLDLLRASLQEFFSCLLRISSQEFIAEWEANLAYRDQWVELFIDNLVQSSSQQAAPPPVQVGKVIGLTQDGSLNLLSGSGELVKVQVGEIHLRPSHSDLPYQSPD